MPIARFLLTLLTIVAFCKIAAGQQFQKEYNTANGVYPYAFSESSDQFILQSTSDGANKFVDLHLDKNGNNASFQVQPYPANAPASAFVRKSAGGILAFARFYGDSILRFYDLNGVLSWEHSFSFTGDVNAISTNGALYKGVELVDGFLLLGGMEETYSNGLNKEYLFALKIDFTGNVLWQQNKEISAKLGSISLAKFFGNKLFFSWQYAVANAGQPFVASIDANGLWSSGLEHSSNMKGTADMAPRISGGVLAVGYYVYPSNPADFFGKATCFDENWQALWQKTGWPELDYISGKQNGLNCFPAAVVADGNGWVMGGNIVPWNAPPGTVHKFLARLDSLGNIVHLNVYSAPSSGISTLHKTSDGGFLLSYRYLLNGGNVGVIKTDSNLIANTNTISGKVFFDENMNCTPDANEMALSGWLIELSNAQDSLYTISNALGEYSFFADTGQWVLRIQSFNPYWMPCDNEVPVHLTTANTTDSVHFALKAFVECPQLEVDIALPFTRRCFDNPLYVHYCNNGTALAPVAQISVVLDPALSLVSTEIPIANIAGDTIFFQIDSLDIGECGQFSMLVHAGCDSTLLGQTVCASAYISPDTFCIPFPLWSGAQVVVGGFCEQDSVVFWFKNTGNASTQLLDYIIIEDMVVWREGNFGPLLPNETDSIRVFANGSSYGLLAEQEPGYPFNAFLPFSNGPSAWVEACNWNGPLPYPGGFITKFNNEDGNPNFSTDCSVLVGSYDPNDKHANPEGIDAEHFILPGTPIEYLIRFQNTGTDTAFQVRVWDELSPWLDPLSLHVQASSHPCSVEIASGNVLKCTFNNIILPDSSTSFQGSQGFVQFSIRPRNELPIGTRIENTAAIFFDFNPPVYTNTYHHTIDTLFLKKQSSPVLSPAIQENTPMQLFPNPALAGNPVSLLGQENYSGHISLFDCSGKLIAVLEATHGKMQLPQKITSGLYFLKTSEGGVGKLGIRN